MRIAAIEAYQRDLPVVGGAFRMARTTVTTLDTTLVRVVTDTGLTGWGETCPVGPAYQPHHARGARAALEEFAPGLIGMDPLAIGLARTRMDERLAGHDYAKAAVDIALWDLAGRHFDMPVSALLGGARCEAVPALGALGVDTPEGTARAAADKLAAGFARLQVKVGGRALETDIEVMRAVHEAVGARARVTVDANRGWTTRDALMASQACADLPLVLEQPCNTLEEVAAIRARLRHPVYLDESAPDLGTVLRAIAADVCDGFAFKLTRAGGISAMRAIRDVCAARSLPYSCNDAWGGDIVAAACVHIAATVEPAHLDGVWIAAPYIEAHYDASGGIRIRDGLIDVPTGQGLGLEIDPAQFGDPVASWV